MTPAPHRDGRAARLLRLSAAGRLSHLHRGELARLFRPGDLVVANDAATLPASLSGRHAATGAPVELRLAAWVSPGDPRRFIAVAFGAGDWRTRTEDRAPPPRLQAGDMLAIGPLLAIVEAVIDAPRLVQVRLAGTPDAVWEEIARHGRPVQYSHVREPLALWDVWTKVAGMPLAFEPPSAGFSIDWRLLSELRDHGIGFATLTLAAGLSSTGDPVLDARFPLDEAFQIPATTARQVARTKVGGGRVIAIGTTVVRALEAAAIESRSVQAGDGIATGRIGPKTRLRIVDAILTGVHQPGESHYELLRAFADDKAIAATAEAAEARGYRNHEFGDFLLIERSARQAALPVNRACTGSRRENSQDAAMAL